MKTKKKKTAGILLASFIMLYSVAGSNIANGSKDPSSTQIPNEESKMNSEASSLIDDIKNN